jgi:hypothetical protein
MIESKKVYVDFCKTFEGKGSWPVPLYFENYPSLKGLSNEKIIETLKSGLTEDESKRFKALLRYLEEECFDYDLKNEKWDFWVNGYFDRIHVITEEEKIFPKKITGITITKDYVFRQYKRNGPIVIDMKDFPSLENLEIKEIQESLKTKKLTSPELELLNKLEEKAQLDVFHNYLREDHDYSIVKVKVNSRWRKNPNRYVSDL